MIAKPWWDTPTARNYGAAGRAMLMLAKVVAYMGHPIPANDRDHLRW